MCIGGEANCDEKAPGREGIHGVAEAWNPTADDLRDASSHESGRESEDQVGSGRRRDVHPVGTGEGHHQCALHDRGDAEVHFLRNAPVRLAFLMESDHLGRFPV